MSRWIDAEYCEDFFDRWESRVKNADPVTIDVVQNTRTLLRDAPSIDIVRCKECKFSESVITSWSTDGKNNVVERLCKVHKWSVKDDDYCSYGERKEGE